MSKHNPNPGIYPGESYDWYAEVEAVSRSQLLWLASSPALYRYRMDEGPTPMTPALLRGIAMHAAALEPETFAKDYVEQDFDLRSKAGKERKAALLAEGKTPLTKDVWAACHAIQKAVRGSGAASVLLGDEGDSEVTVVWDDASTLTRCKGRLDRVFRNAAGKPILVDLKTTRHSSPREFRNDAFRSRLHVQAAYYMDGWEAAMGERPDAFTILAYEATPPYTCSVHEMSEQALELGRAEYRRLLTLLKRLKEEDRWPDYSHVVHTLDVPGWYVEVGEDTQAIEEGAEW